MLSSAGTTKQARRQEMISASKCEMEEVERELGVKAINIMISGLYGLNGYSL